MTRFPHDQFAKDYLKELLSPLGVVETSRDIAGEIREIDVWFIPASLPAGNAQSLGLLGKFAATSAIFEPFRNSPTPSQIRSCMSKLFDIHANLERQYNREENKVKDTDLPQLWMLTPTASVPLLDGFRAILDIENWLPGVHFLGKHLKTAIVAIHQLPRTEETLWLRILGKGTVQKQAIAELAALPESHPLRASALELLYNLQAHLEANQNLDAEDRALIMELAPLYRQRLNDVLEEGRERGRQEGRQEGIEEGRQEGQRVVVENLLKVRFGSLDEELAAIVLPLLQLSPEEFSLLVLQSSREELLARFVNPGANH